MVQYGQLLNTMFNVQHQHSDGTWATMEPESAGEQLNPAALDPEREWLRGHVYACGSCGERVRIAIPEGEQPPG